MDPEIKTPRQELFEEMNEMEIGLNELQRRFKDLKISVSNVLDHSQNSDDLLEKLGERDVSVWTEPAKLPASKIPAFIPIQNRPLGERGLSTRFIAMINLKGGVGKTTISANLSAAFAAGNYKRPDHQKGKPIKVLVVDLDFQGTLSQRCIGSETLNNAMASRATSARLLHPPKNDVAKPKEIAVPFIHRPQMCQVIPADDTLDAEDFKQQAILALKIAEPRFRYREWFHAEKVFKGYDLVIFDCPPRLTSSTVCSIVASDYVFIPTSPDAFDISAVNRTIRWIGTIQRVLDLPVRVAGIILNRTNKVTGLSVAENSRKNELDVYMKEFLNKNPDCDTGKRPFILDALIPKRAGEKDSINGRPGESLPGETVPFFADLASDIYERIY
ncbi:MAG: AAA family ATPase [Planctomycetia bacterium]|nr:AAA family ATPase [Planctomycetia bacterium]